MTFAFLLLMHFGNIFYKAILIYYCLFKFDCSLVEVYKSVRMLKSEIELAAKSIIRDNVIKKKTIIKYTLVKLLIV